MATRVPRRGDGPADPTATGPSVDGPKVGQRRTRQRSAVDDILAGEPAFKTASQLYDLLRQRGESVGLTTVYRTLQLMSEAGDLDAIRTDDGETAYRRCSTTHHHHLVCRSCGRTVEVTGPAVEAWTDRIAAENGFHDVRHDLEIFGVCAACPR